MKSIYTRSVKPVKDRAGYYDPTHGEFKNYRDRDRRQTIAKLDQLRSSLSSDFLACYDSDRKDFLIAMWEVINQAVTDIEKIKRRRSKN